MNLLEDKMGINSDWAAVYKMLIGIGFKLVTEDDDDVVCGFQADFHDQITDTNNLVMVESEIARNMFCLVLKEASPNGLHDYEFWVMEDIGCGWVEMPVRWSEIEIEWLTWFKKAFEGTGFKEEKILK
jgi:hypothetical protein